MCTFSSAIFFYLHSKYHKNRRFLARYTCKKVLGRFKSVFSFVPILPFSHRQNNGKTHLCALYMMTNVKGMSFKRLSIKFPWTQILSRSWYENMQILVQHYLNTCNKILKIFYLLDIRGMYLNECPKFGKKILHIEKEHNLKRKILLKFRLLV